MAYRHHDCTLDEPYIIMKRIPKVDTKTCYENTQPFKGELFLDTKMYELTAIPPESPNLCNETVEQKNTSKI